MISLPVGSAPNSRPLGPSISTNFLAVRYVLKISSAASVISFHAPSVIVAIDFFFIFLVLNFNYLYLTLFCIPYFMYLLLYTLIGIPEIIFGKTN